MFPYYLINALIFLLIGFSCTGFLFRRRYRNTVSRFQEYELKLAQKEAELLVRKEALQLIIYRTHHMQSNPVCKRIRGLSSLGLLAVSRNFRLLELLSKPHHHGYSKLAMEENKEILTALLLINCEAKALEEEAINNVKEFEHLQ